MSVALHMPPQNAGTLQADLSVPSGLKAELFEVLLDDVGAETWARFRFVMPEIARAAGKVTFFDVEADFAHLCSEVALPYLKEWDLSPDVVVVALLDQPAEFGQADDTVTQFIDAFRVVSGACEWEAL